MHKVGCPRYNGMMVNEWEIIVLNLQKFTFLNRGLSIKVTYGYYSNHFSNQNNDETFHIINKMKIKCR